MPGACNVRPSDMTFTFEDLYSGNLAEAGASSQWIDFNVTLTGCPVGMRQVLMKISGVPTDDATYFANAWDALNVVLQLTDSTY